MSDRQAVFFDEYHLDIKVIWHGYHTASVPVMARGACQTCGTLDEPKTLYLNNRTTAGPIGLRLGIQLLLPPNRLRPSFFAIFFKRLDENPRSFRSEHLRTCPNFHYLDILLSHKYFRYFPLTRNVKVNIGPDGG